MQIYLICLVRVLYNQQVLIPYNSAYYVSEMEVIKVVEELRAEFPAKQFTYKTLNPK